MKSLLFSLCVTSLILVPVAASADTGERPFQGDPQHRDGRRGEMFKEKLGLSNEQAAKARQIFASTRGNCFEKNDPAERRACHEQVRDERQKQLAQILTPEQLQKFQAFRDEHKAERQNWRENRGADCPKSGKGA